MNRPFQIQIKELFLFQGGRVVFVGESEDGPAYIPPGSAEVWVDDELRAVLRIEGEMLHKTKQGTGLRVMRSVSTTELRCLTRESVREHRWVLKSLDRFFETIPVTAQSGLRTTMHRHLLGIEDPPPEYVADPMTQGPMLPEGWDGDAWVAPDERGSYLRAWNKKTGQVSYGKGKTYTEARQEVLQDVAHGRHRVEVTTIPENS